MKILLTGSHGLIGSSLIRKLQHLDHEVVRLHRSINHEGPYWNPVSEEIRLDGCDGIDAVIHLAGENVGGKKWNPQVKQRIYRSRVQATEFLVRSLNTLEHPPKILLCASAIGYYGSRGIEELDEDSAPGKGFFADLCTQWEKAAEPGRETGMRVVNMRLGVILSRYGGALPELAKLTKFFINPKMGSGRQMISWIDLREAVDAICWMLVAENISGPVNIVSPNPIPSAGLAQSLCAILGRPGIIPLPAFALRLGLGEMADEMLLTSQNVVPKKLLNAGFGFRSSSIEDTLRGIYS